CAELKLPRRVRRPRDLAGGRQNRIVLRRPGEHRPVGYGEICAVERVEHFDPELDLLVCDEREVLDEREIDVGKSRSAQEVARRVAEGALRLQDERRRIERLIRVAWKQTA